MHCALLNLAIFNANLLPTPLSGGCDFVTGQCECDEFRFGDSDLGDCGGYAIEASGWTGIER